MGLSWNSIRNKLQQLAVERGHWFGYPLPDEFHELVLAKDFPYQDLNGVSFGDEHRMTIQELVSQGKLLMPEGTVILNSWRLSKYNNTVSVLLYRVPGDPKTRKFFVDRVKPVDMILYTIGVSRNWSMAAEARAMAKLQQMITPHAFRCYVSTGTFIESSPRSNVGYVFRRCRPTIAISQYGGELSNLCALCLHPIGYYHNTFGGVMVPTDDVLTHLILMRGDEKMYWRQANQHPVTWPEAGMV